MALDAPLRLDRIHDRTLACPFCDNPAPGIRMAKAVIGDRQATREQVRREYLSIGEEFVLCLVAKFAQEVDAMRNLLDLEELCIQEAAHPSLVTGFRRQSPEGFFMKRAELFEFRVNPGGPSVHGILSHSQEPVRH